MVTRRVGARLVTIVVVFFVCAELMALMAHYVETGGLFYTHDKAYQDVLPTVGMSYRYTSKGRCCRALSQVSEGPNQSHLWEIAKT